MNEKDNLLKYQISEDKEENELLEALMFDNGSAVTASQAKKLSDGQMISTEQ